MGTGSSAVAFWWNCDREGPLCACRGLSSGRVSRLLARDGVSARCDRTWYGRAGGAWRRAPSVREPFDRMESRQSGSGSRRARLLFELRHLFGPTSARGTNTGCGPRYTEVEWGALVGEFRLSKFSGFRYLKGGWPLTTPGSPREASPPKTVFPKLATARGIALGGTLAQLRRAYRPLRIVGTDTWRATNGLTFVDNARHDPERLSSRIIEIKVGTCGNF